MNIEHIPNTAQNARTITFRADELRSPGGITIAVPGFAANPADKDDEQVFIEIYDGKLRVHIWNGKEDPTTVECEPVNPCGEIKMPTLNCPISKKPCEEYDKCHQKHYCHIK